MPKVSTVDDSVTFVEALVAGFLLGFENLLCLVAFVVTLLLVVTVEDFVPIVLAAVKPIVSTVVEDFIEMGVELDALEAGGN